MNHMSRRAVMAGLASSAIAPVAFAAEPQTLLVNGKIWTGNRKQPWADSLLTEGGRILAVGVEADVRARAPAGLRAIDIGGKTVLPGFNDAHSHPAEAGLQFLRNVACDQSSIEAVQAALRARAERTKAGEWIIGYLYDDAKTPRPINRYDLDAAVPDHPAIVRHRGGHTAFVNSRALALAGINDQTPDPAGGRYGRADSKLTGLVADTAAAQIEALIPNASSADDYRRAAEVISKQFVAKGITSACDADAALQHVLGYRDARDNGSLAMRVYCLADSAQLDRFTSAGIGPRWGDDRVRVGGIKMFADGSISERTAWLSEPYLEMQDSYFGLQLASQEQLYQMGVKAHRAGFQLGTHANGDLAIGRILDVYEQIIRDYPKRDPRFRIEHCTLPTQAQITRMKALGVIPTPFSAYVYFHGDVMHFYGAARTARMFPMRSFIDAGLRPTDASDYTASPADPMMWMQSQLTRADMAGQEWGLNQKISLEEALICGTRNGAYASFEETAKGMLRPGYAADLVVLERDLFTTDPHDFLNIGVQRTMVGGVWRFEA